MKYITSNFAKVGPDHNPEPTEQLRARFEKAIERVLVMPAPRTGPGPEHRFDFEDGVRVCVTLEDHDGVHLIHASLSAFVPGPIRATPDPEVALRKYWALLTDRPFTTDRDGVVMSDRGHPHVWMRFPA